MSIVLVARSHPGLRQAGDQVGAEAAELFDAWETPTGLAARLL